MKEEKKESRKKKKVKRKSRDEKYDCGNKRIRFYKKVTFNMNNHDVKSRNR